MEQANGTKMVEYDYDAEGRRVRAVAFSGVEARTHYVYDAAGRLLAEYSGVVDTVDAGAAVSGDGPLGIDADIAARVEKLERGHERAASVIEILVEDIDRLAGDVKDMKALPPVKKRRIGFRIGNEDDD